MKLASGCATSFWDIEFIPDGKKIVEERNAENTRIRYSKSILTENRNFE